MADINEILCKAIDTIVTKKIESINYDKTLVCTITSAEYAKEGKYTVNDGSVSFTAYSTNTEYTVNTSVYVTVPNNDFNEEKIIIGKYNAKTEEPFIFTSPFSTMIDITTNLIKLDADKKKISQLWANMPAATDEHPDYRKEILIWQNSYVDAPLTGYTRLGLQGQFKSWLRELKATSGEYGLRLELLAKAELSESIKKGLELVLEELDKEDPDYNAIQNKYGVTWGQNSIEDYNSFLNSSVYADTYYNTQVALVEANYASNAITKDEYDSSLKTLKEEYDANVITARKENIQDILNNYQHFTMYLNTSDMYGNPYQFDSYYQQEKVFDISSIPPIVYMELYFYEIPCTGKHNDLTKYLTEDTKNVETAAAAVGMTPTYDTKGQLTNSESIRKAILDYYSKNLISDETRDLYLSYLDDFKDDFTPIKGFHTKELEDIAYTDWLGGLLAPNLYEKDSYLCLGYGVGEYDDESALLYTLDSTTYLTDENVSDSDNVKEIYLRWIHIDDDDNTIIIEDTTDMIVDIRWYRYDEGKSPSDSYCGSSWRRIEGVNGFSYDFTPSSSKNSEQIKVIIIYENNIIKSNILTFTNQIHQADTTALDITNSVTIWCADNSYGNYLMYGYNYELMDSSEGQNCRCFECHFQKYTTGQTEKEETSPLLSEAQSITWYFPLDDTMLVASDIEGYKIDYNDFSSNITEWTYQGLTGKISYAIEADSIADNDSSVGYFTITYYASEADGLTIYPYQYYYIEDYYEQAKSNNTVQCDVFKHDQVHYSGEKICTFGVSGTNGTSDTLQLDFENNKNVFDVGRIKEDGNYSLCVKAHLYDASHKEVDLSQEDELIYEWTWYKQDALKLYTSTGNVETLDYYTQVDFDANSFNTMVDVASNKETWDSYVAQDKLFSYDEDSNTYTKITASTLPKVKDSDGNDTAEIDYDNNMLYTYREFYYASYVAVTSGSDVDETQQYYFISDNSISEAILDTSEGTGKHAFISGRTYYTRVMVPVDNGTLLVTNTTTDPITYKLPTYDGTVSLVAISGGYSCPKIYYEKHSEENYSTDWLKISVADTKYRAYLVETDNTITTTNKMDSLYILELRISGWKSDEADLTAFLPIPLRNYEKYGKKYSCLTGPDRVTYPTTGEPEYFKDPYRLWLYPRSNNINTKSENSNENGEFQICYPIIYNTTTNTNNSTDQSKYVGTLTEDGVLKPLGIYIDNAPAYGVQYHNTDDNMVVWTQPIVVLRSNYFSRLIDNWDGKTITMDEDSGTILASAISAGRKETDNSFSGVIMGDWSRSDTTQQLTKTTGIYGFNHGAASYAFRDDGTAFIGKDGSGRIVFDGNSGAIYSQSYTLSGVDTNGFTTSLAGMKIDLDDGIIDIKGTTKATLSTDEYTHELKYSPTNSRIKISAISPYIYVQSEAGNDLFYVGNDRYFLKTDDWDPENHLGTYLDLKNGKLQGYNFNFTAYKADNPNYYIQMNGGAQTYPFIVNGSAVTSISWDGTFTATNGNFSGNIRGANIYASYMESSEITSTMINTSTLNSSTINSSTINSSTVNSGTFNGGEYNLFVGFLTTTKTQGSTTVNTVYSMSGISPNVNYYQDSACTDSIGYFSSIDDAERAYGICAFEFPIYYKTTTSSGVTSTSTLSSPGYFTYYIGAGGPGSTIDVSQIKSQTVMGQMGYIAGSDGTNTTNNLGMSTNTGYGIVFNSGGNARISTAGGLFLTSNGSNGTTSDALVLKYTPTDSYIRFASDNGGIYVKTPQIKFVDIDATNQIGIYARFA